MPYCIAFRSAIPIDDNYFNIDDDIDFKICFNKFINHKLNLYKTSADAKDSVYLTDKKTDNIKSKKNATLLGSSFANNIISDLADIHNNSETDKIKSKILYLFDNSKVGESNTESLIMNNRSKSCRFLDNYYWKEN